MGFDRRKKMPITCAQLVIKWLVDNQPCVSVMYVQKMHTDVGILLSDGGDPATFDSGAADDVATNVKTWLQDHWSGFAGDAAAATALEVVWNTVEGVGPLSGKVYADSDYPIVGTLGATNLPNSVTAAVTLKTGILGRSHHGRSYVVGLAAEHIAEDKPNVLTPTTVTALPALYNELFSGLNGWHSLTAPADRYQMGVMSYRHDGAERAVAQFTPGTDWKLTDSYVDSMRRRLPGHNRSRYHG